MSLNINFTGSDTGQKSNPNSNNLNYPNAYQFSNDLIPEHQNVSGKGSQQNKLKNKNHQHNVSKEEYKHDLSKEEENYNPNEEKQKYVPKKEYHKESSNHRSQQSALNFQDHSQQKSISIDLNDLGRKEQTLDINEDIQINYQKRATSSKINANKDKSIMWGLYDDQREILLKKVPLSEYLENDTIHGIGRFRILFTHGKGASGSVLSVCDLFDYRKFSLKLEEVNPKVTGESIEKLVYERLSGKERKSLQQDKKALKEWLDVLRPQPNYDNIPIFKTKEEKRQEYAKKNKQRNFAKIPIHSKPVKKNKALGLEYYSTPKDENESDELSKIKEYEALQRKSNKKSVFLMYYGDGIVRYKPALIDFLRGNNQQFTNSLVNYSNEQKEPLIRYTLIEDGICSLNDLILYRKKNKMLFSPQEVLYIIERISKALFILKKDYIAHRDVKPANIIICFNKTHKFQVSKNEVLIKLADFSHSHLFSKYDESYLLETSHVGTERFMAPELNEKNNWYDPFQADIYSLAVIFLILLENMDKYCIIEPIAFEKLEPDKFERLKYIQEKSENIQEKLEPEFERFMSIILKMLDKNPTTRISIEDLRTYLEKHRVKDYLRGVGVKIPLELTKLVSEANQGDPECLFALGQLHQERVLNSKKIAQESKKLQKAKEVQKEDLFSTASTGKENSSADSLNVLHDKKSNRNDEQKAFDDIRKSAEQGHPKAQYEVGLDYKQGKYCEQSDQKQFEYLEKSAKNGYGLAQLELGECYYHGIGCNKDFQKAFEWFEESSMNKIPKAMYRLGCCYEQGKGCEKIVEMAFYYYSQAALLNDPDGQFCLGLYYFKGIGCNINENEAIKWWEKAAMQGHIEAQANLGDFYFSKKEHRASERKTLQSRGYQWSLKAANANNAMAQYNVGRYLERQKKMNEALKWYRKSANQGYEKAINYLKNHKGNKEYLSE